MKDWAERICGLTLDKSLQKIDWSTVTLTPTVLKYMTMDVWVLFEFLNYLPQLEDTSILYTWDNSREHDPFITSIQLDQVIQYRSIEMSLAGLLIDGEELKNVTTQFDATLHSILCDELGLTLKQFRSAPQLEAKLQESNICGMAECLEVWPKTPTGGLCLSTDKLHTFLYKIWRRIKLGLFGMV